MWVAIEVAALFAFGLDRATELQRTWRRYDGFGLTMASKGVAS